MAGRHGSEGGQFRHRVAPLALLVACAALAFAAVAPAAWAGSPAQDQYSRNLPTPGNGGGSGGGGIGGAPGAPASNASAPGNQGSGSAAWVLFFAVPLVAFASGAAFLAYRRRGGSGNATQG